MTPEKLGERENPKKNRHRFPMGRGNRQELQRKLGARWGRRGGRSNNMSKGVTTMMVTPTETADLS